LKDSLPDGDDPQRTARLAGRRACRFSTWQLLHSRRMGGDRSKPVPLVSGIRLAV